MIRAGCWSAIRFSGGWIPQHVFESDDWLVKSSSKHRNAAVAEEEMAFVMENPHRDHFARVFALARIDFGRADYTIVDGRIQVYEINTNPNLPGLSDRKGDSAKAARRNFFRNWMNEAFAALDTPIRPGPPVRFTIPAPRFHRMRTWTPEESTPLFRAWNWLVQKNPKWARRVPGRAWVRSMIRSFQSR